jgi:hypothetical protein
LWKVKFTATTRLNFEMLLSFRSVVTLRTNMQVSLVFLAKGVIQGTALGLEDLKEPLVHQQIALVY